MSAADIVTVDALALAAAEAFRAAAREAGVDLATWSDSVSDEQREAA